MSTVPRLVALSVVGLVLGTVVGGFLLLFSSVPPGWHPFHGSSPQAARIFAMAYPVPSVSLSPLDFQRTATLVSLTAWLLWAAAIALACRIRESERRTALAVVTVVATLAHVVLVFLPPALSNDLYRYALFGKMIGLGLNPLVTPAAALVGDPLLSLTTWTDHRSLYGPTFLWIAAAVVHVVGDAPVALAIAFRAVAAAGNLLTCWLVYRLARAHGDDGLRPLLVWAWCPLALVETAGAGHTEAVMLPLALAGLLAARRGRAATATALFVAGAAVKYMAAVLLPLWLAHAFASAPDRRTRVRLGLRVGVAGVATLVALYGPFWAGMATLGEAFDHLAGRVDAAPGASWAAIGVFVVVALGALVSAARGGLERVAVLGGIITITFILVVFPYRFPWYFLSPIAFAVPWARSSSARVGAGIALLLGLLSTLLYGALLPLERQVLS